jgi:hypothetical protein
MGNSTPLALGYIIIYASYIVGKELITLWFKNIINHLKNTKM